MPDTDRAKQLLDFWFSEPMNKHWFKSTDAIDQSLRQQYRSLWQQAKEGQLDHWLNNARHCLALIILLDQLPLNMFRGQVDSFTTEQQAIAATHHALKQGFAEQLNDAERSFLLMPLMHSEKLSDQDLSVALYEKYGLAENAKFARHHRELIERFGRFPHRNAILGRKSSKAEIDYLNSDEAFTG